MLGDTPADDCARALLAQHALTGGHQGQLTAALRAAASRLSALAIEAEELAWPQNPHSGAERERLAAAVERDVRG